MTLIELLVALVIFGVLGVMGYRAVASAVDARARVVNELQRWRDISNFFQVLESDLSQYAERPQPAGTPANTVVDSLRLASSDSIVEFSFLKLDGAGGNVRRRGYRFETPRIVQLRWPGTDALSQPDAYPVLENVTRVQCSLVSADGLRRTAWPDPQPGSAGAPVAIDIELELSNVGTIRRLIALR